MVNYKQTTLFQSLGPQSDLEDKGKSDYTFRTKNTEQGLLIWYQNNRRALWRLELGPIQMPVLYLTGCNKETLIEFIYIPSSFINIYHTKRKGMMLIEDKDYRSNKLYLPPPQSKVNPYRSVEVLSKTPGKVLFRLLYPNQDFRDTGPQPLFFMDEMREFFVIPITERIPIFSVKKGSTDPGIINTTWSREYFS